jgi:hypothetical protein
MLAVVISINGEQILTAGAEDWELLLTGVLAKRVADTDESECEMNVSGLPKQLEKGKLEHLRWGRRPLRIGDEITIRLVEVLSADPPIKRYRSDRHVQEDPFTDDEMRDFGESGKPR